eukprot:5237622-Prymnesium_polylepis.3
MNAARISLFPRAPITVRRIASAQEWAFLTLDGGIVGYSFLPLLLFFVLDAITFAQPDVPREVAEQVESGVKEAETGKANTDFPQKLLAVPLTLLRSTPMRWFSGISMCVYMIHCEVFRYVKYFEYKVHFEHPPPANAGAAVGFAMMWICAIALVVPLAWVVNAKFEVPVARQLERLLLPPKS